MTDTSPGTPSYVPPNDLEKLREAVQRDMNLVMDLREEVERLRVDLTSWRLRGNEATEKCWALEEALAAARALCGEAGDAIDCEGMTDLEDRLKAEAAKGGK